MAARSINDWVAALEPMSYWQAAPEILKSLRAYPPDASEREREADSKQVGNALIAWAMIAAKEIQEDLAHEIMSLQDPAGEASGTTDNGFGLRKISDQAFHAPIHWP